MKTAYLGLGSNLGDRLGILRAAVAQLRGDPRIVIAKISSVYETKPVGVTAQPDFLNAVVQIETVLPAEQLLQVTQRIENALGRERHERWGPRTLDVDLLWYEGVRSDDATLTLPHPRMKERSFVLTPLAEIAPELQLEGERVAVLAARLDQSGLRRVSDVTWADGGAALRRNEGCGPREVSARGSGASEESRRKAAPTVEFRELHGAPAPERIFAGLSERSGSFFLESGLESGGLGQWSFIGFDPFLVFHAKGGTITVTTPAGREVFVGEALTELRKLCEKFRAPARSGEMEIPFCGGAVGGFSYEYGSRLERVGSGSVDEWKMPDAQFGFYDGVLAFERGSGRVYAVANPVASASAEEIFARLERAVSGVGRGLPTPPVVRGSNEMTESQRRGRETPPYIEPRSNFSKGEYLGAVQRIKDYIAAGDVYQVNLAQRFEAPLRGTAFSLYERLRERSPAPFAGFLNLGDFQVVSSSPERFLRVRDGRIETRPIKGTRPRGATPEEDARLKAELLASEKDRAELLMIVDLERNDLGRVCEYGSVRVDESFQVETHPTVFHLVSAVSGKLRAGCDVFDAVRATFPGGSITGAPKIRAMQVIDEIETRRRDWYTGAVGYIGFDGACDFNIAIRTILCRGERAYYHVGGGIVWDSDPESEYQETLDKGRAMRAALMAK